MNQHGAHGLMLDTVNVACIMVHMSNTNIANIQDAIIDIPVGKTRVVFGYAITRWTKDEYEVGTWGHDENKMGSEHAAEMIAEAM